MHPLTSSHRGVLAIVRAVIVLLTASCVARPPQPLAARTSVAPLAATLPGQTWDPRSPKFSILGPDRVVQTGWGQLDIGAAENYEHPADQATKCPDPDAMTTKGTVNYRDGVWTLTGAGEGFWHGWDQGNLVYFKDQIRGDFTFTAQVTDFRMVTDGVNLNGVAEAVLNVRDGLGYRQPTQSFVAGSAPKAFVFQGRYYWTGDKYNQWWYWPERKLPDKRPLLGWIRIRRRGDALDAFSSGDGKEWGEPVKSNNPNHPFPLHIVNAPAVYVGLVCTARNDRNYAPMYQPEGKVETCRDPNHGILTEAARCVFQNVTLTQP